MNNKKSLPRIVIFSIMTMITTFVWIGFDVYRSITKEPPLGDVSEVIEPLDPTLDINLLSDLTQRVYLEESDIGDTELISIDATIEEEPIVEEATEEANINEI